MSDKQIRFERAAILVGQVLGQLSELLNNIKTLPMTNEQVYKSVLDITKAASLHVHDIYYKGNTPDCRPPIMDRKR